MKSITDETKINLENLQIDIEKEEYKLNDNIIYKIPENEKISVNFPKNNIFNKQKIKNINSLFLKKNLENINNDHIQINESYKNNKEKTKINFKNSINKYENTQYFNYSYNHFNCSNNNLIEVQENINNAEKYPTSKFKSSSNINSKITIDNKEFSNYFNMNNLNNFIKTDKNKSIEKFENQKNIYEIKFLNKYINDSFKIDNTMNLSNSNLSIENFDLEEKINFLINIFNSKISISNKKISFILNYLEKMPKFINSDSKLISQIIFNIFANSIKYLHNGKVNINVLKNKIFHKNSLGKEFIIINIIHPYLISNETSILSLRNSKSINSTEVKYTKNISNQNLENKNTKNLNFRNLNKINLSNTNKSNLFLKLIMKNLKNLLVKLGGDIIHEILDLNEISYKILIPNDSFISDKKEKLNDLEKEKEEIIIFPNDENKFNKNLTMKNQIFYSQEIQSEKITLNDSHINFNFNVNSDQLKTLKKINDSYTSNLLSSINNYNNESNNFSLNKNNNEIKKKSSFCLKNSENSKIIVEKNFYKLFGNTNIILNEFEKKKSKSLEKKIDYKNRNNILINHICTNKIKSNLNNFYECKKNNIISNNFDEINEPYEFYFDNDSSKKYRSNSLPVSFISSSNTNKNNINLNKDDNKSNIMRSSLIYNKDNSLAFINSNKSNNNSSIFNSKDGKFDKISQSKRKIYFNKSNNLNSFYNDQSQVLKINSSISTRVLNDFNLNLTPNNQSNSINQSNYNSSNCQFVKNNLIDYGSSEESFSNNIINHKYSDHNDIITKNIEVINNLNNLDLSLINKIKNMTIISNVSNLYNPINNTDNLISNNLNFNDYDLKILLVEDEKFIRSSQKNLIIKHLKKINSKLNILIEECEDGIDCIHKIYQAIRLGLRYDLILSDETMDFMNGTMMAYIIKGLVDRGVFYDINIHLITSYETDSSIFLSNQLFKAMYTKPLSKVILDSIFSGYLENEKF